MLREKERDREWVRRSMRVLFFSKGFSWRGKGESLSRSGMSGLRKQIGRERDGVWFFFFILKKERKGKKERKRKSVRAVVGKSRLLKVESWDWSLTDWGKERGQRVRDIFTTPKSSIASHVFFFVLYFLNGPPGHAGLVALAQSTARKLMCYPVSAR